MEHSNSTTIFLLRRISAKFQRKYGNSDTKLASLLMGLLALAPFLFPIAPVAAQQLAPVPYVPPPASRLLLIPPAPQPFPNGCENDGGIGIIVNPCIGMAGTAMITIRVQKPLATPITGVTWVFQECHFACGFSNSNTATPSLNSAQPYTPIFPIGGLGAQSGLAVGSTFTTGVPLGLCMNNPAAFQYSTWWVLAEQGPVGYGTVVGRYEVECL